jgi:5-methyltetrahydropteroyltriglutamate--homocysteine methyltransferase
MAHWSEIPLLTTAVGSYPPGDLPPKRAIQRAVEDQIAAGIDLISDGQVRGDLISLFAAGIPGFRQAPDGVWELVAPPDQPTEPLAAADYLLARLLAKGRAAVKGIITGPITLALSTRLIPGTPYDSNSDPLFILRLADILAREAAALVAAGAEIVQIDEPMLPDAIQNGLDSDLAEQALRNITAILPFSILHACADVRPVAYELLAMPVAALNIAGASIDLLNAFDADDLESAGIKLVYGCVDTQATAPESRQIIQQRIERAVERLGEEHLWLSPDCGLRLYSREDAQELLGELADAAQAVRASLDG